MEMEIQLRSCSDAFGLVIDLLHCSVLPLHATITSRYNVALFAIQSQSNKINSGIDL